MSFPSHRPHRGGLFFSVEGPDDPEALARLVLRCREFSHWLADVGRDLPSRADMPFLYDQLDGAARALFRTLTELGARPDSPAESEEEPQEGAFGLQGTAWTIPVTEMLDFLSHASKTGVLFVTTFQETFLFEFTDGALVHATSDKPPVEMRLGEILVAQNVLARGELEEHVSRASAAEEMLGSYLVKVGAVSERDLHQAMAIQVQSLFNRISKADNAIYRFREGPPEDRGQGLDVNIKRLLLESARLQDEQSAEAALLGFGEDLLPILPFDPIEPSETLLPTQGEDEDEEIGA